MSLEANKYPEYLAGAVKYQRLLFSPLKHEGYVPENETEVFVRRIPPDTTEEDLLEFFQSAGRVFQVRLMMSTNEDTNRGFGYVTFFDSASAKRAVANLNSVVFRNGRRLIIENSLNNCRLFIGGIPTFKRKDEVWQELYCLGVRNIIDVIMYRSYSDRAENRGFVFVEFKTHEEAAHFRSKYSKNLKLWDARVVVDWSIPVPHVDEDVMKKVRVIYLRNLDVCQSREDIQDLALKCVPRSTLEKVYKFKNYAFIHLMSRESAERLLSYLQEYFKETIVEVTWAKPPGRLTTQEYRHSQVSFLSSKSKMFNRDSPNSCPHCCRTTTDEDSQMSTSFAGLDLHQGGSPMSMVSPMTPSPLPQTWTQSTTPSVSPMESFSIDSIASQSDLDFISSLFDDPLEVYQRAMQKLYG